MGGRGRTRGRGGRWWRCSPPARPRRSPRSTRRSWVKPHRRSPGPTLGGGSFNLAAWRGRWVVVNFFASWCPPCQQEQPELVAFAYAHRSPADAALVGVVFDDSASTARSFMRSTGATWPAVVDGGGQIALDYGVRGPPETFIVSPDGTVVAHFDGPMTNASLDYWLTRAQGSRP